MLPTYHLRVTESSRDLWLPGLGFGRRRSSGAGPIVVVVLVGKSEKNSGGLRYWCKEFCL